MSFMRALAGVAVGFAASKGVEQYRKMGGMAGMQEMMKGMTGGANPMASMMDQVQSMANTMGLPNAGAGNPMADMVSAFSSQANAAGEAGMAGLGGLMSAFQGAALGAGKSADDMVSSFFAETPAAVAMEENAKMMIRAMIMAAKADGEIDAQERATILDQLGDIDPEERAFVEAELAAPLDPVRLATDSGDAVKAQIYAASLTAMKIDTMAEVTYLEQVAQALQLPDSVRARVHQAMGVPLPT